jgi:hypothetical protein
MNNYLLFKMKHRFSVKLLSLMLSITVLGSGAMAQVTVNASLATATANYTTINSAFVAINAGTHKGVIEILITANVNEGTNFTSVPLAASGQGSASYSKITIRPTANVTVSGSPNTSTTTTMALLELDGADNVKIDGNIGGVKSLTLKNTNTTATFPTAVIWLKNRVNAGLGCVYDSIVNCNLIGNSVSYSGTNTYYFFGIIAGAETTIGTANQAGNNLNNLYIGNNTIKSCTYGINVGGSPGAPAYNINIENNTIGGADTSEYMRQRGIHVANTSSGTINGNTITNVYSMVNIQTGGIILGTGVSGLTITNNKVSKIYKEVIATTPANMSGIEVAGANNIVANNVISEVVGVNYTLPTNPTSYHPSLPSGIRITSGYNHKIYHNSVNMVGAQNVNATVTSMGAAAAFFVNFSGLNKLDIRNNIFANSMTSTNNGFRGYAICFASGYALSTSGNSNR